MLFKDITVIDENYEAQEHFHILVEGNKIAYVGKEMPADYTGEVYDGKNKVAMPGFFNIHSHIPMPLLRGYGEGLPLQNWLFDRMFPFEAKLTPEDCYWGALLGQIEMIKSGVTSFTDMYMMMDGIVRAVDESGMKANLSHGSSNANGGFYDCNGYKGAEFLLDYEKTRADDRIIADVSIHAEYTSCEQMVREAAEYCKEKGKRMHVHLSETAKEHNECKANRGVTPTRFFADCGVFDNPTTAAHCVWLEGEDFDILKEYGVTPAHCPSSNMKLGSGVANLKKMLEMGINIGIGTDGAASNNNLNMLEEVNLAALIQKGVNHDPLFLSQKELLKMSTLNGARSQGRMDCGAIKVGNRADIVVWDLDKPHMQPVFDVVANILYAGHADDVCLNMIDGKVVYKDGILNTIDEEKVIAQCKSIKERILGEL